MKRIYFYTLALAGFAFLLSACTKDLDTLPLDKDDLSSDKVYDNPANYKLILAKLYAGLSTTGQEGPAGKPDISGIDEGFGQYLRGYFYMQELTTDEAIITWNDQTIKDLHYQTWSSSDVFISAFYYRIFYQIAACNEFIRETTEEKLNERGISGAIRTDIGYFRAEARFLRALSYWHAMDLFANVPFITEDDNVGSFFPERITRDNLYTYVVDELKAIEGLLMDAGTNEYARADKASAWMLLAKVYLNSKVYVGEERYTECVGYCKKIIDAGYILEDEYSYLFLADNDHLGEVIFPVTFDGVHSKTYGGTDFIIHAAVGGSMEPDDFGVDGGWAGLRVTREFVFTFLPDTSGNTDQRAMFFKDGQTLNIEDVASFNDGYAITKFKNLKRDGSGGQKKDFVDTDFPMFRLADVYLMYAEAVLRGGTGGDQTTALGYINALRERAFGNTTGNIAATDLTLDLILNERARELYWECHRRTDLIRFTKFTGGDYIWQWKGGPESMDGKATDAKYNIFPIPASDLSANPNLQQNPGY